MVVVGGGAAGCALASRLTEDAARRVLLIEAGPDYPDPVTLPHDVRDSSQPTVDHDWGHFADPELDRGMHLPRGRIMGGCSATNACFALRGAPRAYDQWAERGNPGWAFADVLDEFRRLERDEDVHDQWHGTDGPIRIRRHPAQEINEAQSAFLAGLVSLRHPSTDDHNRPDAVGAGPSPRNAIDGLRMSTAITYLAVARSRPNLTIRPDTEVAHVELVGTRASGVRLADGMLIEADRVVLAAGTYASPMILCRSGIGRAADLAALGIRPVIDLPGVGNNLVDHVLISVDVIHLARPPDRVASRPT